MSGRSKWRICDAKTQSLDDKRNLSLKAADMSEYSCRLCSGATTYMFSNRILDKWTADYYRCGKCASLQVAECPWIEEVYQLAEKYQGFAFDTGLVARNLLLAGCIGNFLRAARFARKKILDFGGGTGLLTRLLRDMGFNAFCYDAYKAPQLVSAFYLGDLRQCNDADITVAFEVMEHFFDVAKNLEELLQSAPLVVFTTDFYSDQSENWDYLGTFNGQHVMFYSERAMAFIEEKYKVHYVNAGVFKLFVRRNFFSRSDLDDLQSGLNSVARPGAHIEGLLSYLLNPFGNVANDHLVERDAWIKRTFPLVKSG